MQDSAIPVKFAIIFASSAPAGDVTSPIPMTAQSGGLVSFPTGWQEINFTPVDAGGVPPFGKDFNGLFQVVSEWLQWYQAGGPITYDATFQAGVSPAGYPLGAIVQSATVPGKYWRSTTDNNVTNPDTGGAGWAQWPFSIPMSIANGGTNTAGPFGQGSVIFFDGAKFAQNNANFYWLDSLQRLGVGTNAPNANLDVRGSGNFSGTVQIGGQCNAGGGIWSGSLDIVTNSPNSGIGIVCAGGTGPVVELQTGPSGNTWVIQHRISDAALTWSFNTLNKVTLSQSGDISLSGNANIGGTCNADGGLWTGNLDIVSNDPGTGIGVVNSTGPVIALQTGPSGNTWVLGHDPATADFTWSFNTAGKARLDQFGNLTIQGTYSPSDISLKRAIRELEPTLERLSRVRPISFEYANQPGARNLGVIAQEVQAEFPELVREERDGTLAVAYDKLTAVLLGAVRELTARVVELESARGDS